MLNRTLLNESFSSEIKRQVWSKAEIIEGYLPNEYRKDVLGHVIAWGEYGNRKSKHGWEIDHIVPKAMRLKEGFQYFPFDNINNLQPLYWRSNASKSDSFPWIPFKKPATKKVKPTESSRLYN